MQTSSREHSDSARCRARSSPTLPGRQRRVANIAPGVGDMFKPSAYEQVTLDRRGLIGRKIDNDSCDGAVMWVGAEWLCNPCPDYQALENGLRSSNVNLWVAKY